LVDWDQVEGKEGNDRKSNDSTGPQKQLFD